MMDVHFQAIQMLYLLWLLPVVLAIYGYAGYQRRRALRNFADPQLLTLINGSVNPVRRRWKIGLMLAALLLTVVALSRPSWNPTPKKVERRGRDVVFVLDVSKSMLAEDLVPNRLERAKLAIMDCVEKLTGDRVGLVVFAGTAVTKCPLTLDYGFFRMMLESITPESISRGGTKIGDAIRTTIDDAFENQDKRFKDIILITDGEDHDSFPVEAAQEAGRRGIRLLAIGLGDENQGKRIPVTDESGRQSFLQYNGQEVWTKLDADTLRKMVDATPGGKYLNVSTGTLDLGDIYLKLVAAAEKKALEAKTIERYEEKFQIFIALALVLFCVEGLLGDRRKGNHVNARA